MKQVLCVIQDDDIEPGLVGEWATDRGLVVREVKAREGTDDLDPSVADLIVPLGSDAAAYNDEEWIAQEREFLRRAVTKGVPVLGVCFGGQLLASALGGEVARAPVPEVGWVPIRSSVPNWLSEGPWMAWHLDRFTLTNGAEQRAATDHAIQAFTYGPHLGVQFHPEVTPAIVKFWVEKGREALERLNADGDRLVADAHQYAARARRDAYRLFDAFATRAFS